MLRENITAAGLNTAEIKAGERLQIGESVLEATIPCEPCYRMDEIRMGLQTTLKDRRGMLFRVMIGGKISCGDGIERVPAGALISSTGGKVD